MHTVVIKNNTGTTANDLHVNLIHAATGDPPIGPAFSGNSGTGSKTIDFTGASGIPDGSSTGISWESKFASDTLDPVSPGNWTFNGTNIGAINTWASAGLSPSFSNLGGGQVGVAVNNSTASDIAYSGFTVYTDANLSSFDPADYLANETTGALVLSSASGILAPGENHLGSFDLSTLGYTAISLTIGGETFAGAGAQLPEPGTWILFSTALL